MTSGAANRRALGAAPSRPSKVSAGACGWLESVRAHQQTSARGVLARGSALEAHAEGRHRPLPPLLDRALIECCWAGRSGSSRGPAARSRELEHAIMCRCHGSSRSRPALPPRSSGSALWRGALSGGRRGSFQLRMPCVPGARLRGGVRAVRALPRAWRPVPRTLPIGGSVVTRRRCGSPSSGFVP